MPKVDPWTIVSVDAEALALIQALADPGIGPRWRARLIADPRLIKPCEACGHPGYMHEHAERQYELGPYGVSEFEAGDICCEAEQDTGGHISGCSCEWYEGDNWKRRA